jgi:hypothetical protein
MKKITVIRQAVDAGADTEIKEQEQAMSTRKQIEANRRNAQKSTGPKTMEGRTIISRNAITHGLTAALGVLLPEEQEEYNRFAAVMRAV